MKTVLSIIALYSATCSYAFATLKSPNEGKTVNSTAGATVDSKAAIATATATAAVETETPKFPEGGNWFSSMTYSLPNVESVDTIAELKAGDGRTAFPKEFISDVKAIFAQKRVGF